MSPKVALNRFDENNLFEVSLSKLVWTKKKSNFAKRISVSVIEKCLFGVTRKSARFFVKRSLHTDWVTRSFTVRTSVNARARNDTIGRKWRISIFSFLLFLLRRQGDSLRRLFVTPREHLLTRQVLVNCVCPPYNDQS